MNFPQHPEKVAHRTTHAFGDSQSGPNLRPSTDPALGWAVQSIITQKGLHLGDCPSPRAHGTARPPPSMLPSAFAQMMLHTLSLPLKETADGKLRTKFVLSNFMAQIYK
jgi:hypothetical protein